MCPCTRSHELRTPVHGMSCASELLVARASIAADSEAAYLLSVVRASCRLMLCTITNVLDLKTIEAAADGGRTHRLMRCEPLDVRALLADVLDVCRVGCTARIEQLHAAQPPDLPAVLEVCVGASLPALDCTSMHFDAPANPDHTARRVMRIASTSCFSTWPSSACATPPRARRPAPSQWNCPAVMRAHAPRARWTYLSASWLRGACCRLRKSAPRSSRTAATTGWL